MDQVVRRPEMESQQSWCCKAGNADQKENHA
jgi:hypothetical protein